MSTELACRAKRPIRSRFEVLDPSPVERRYENHSGDASRNSLINVPPISLALSRRMRVGPRAESISPPSPVAAQPPRQRPLIDIGMQ
jgi:hypothetical protein